MKFLLQHRHTSELILVIKTPVHGLKWIWLTWSSLGTGAWHVLQFGTSKIVCSLIYICCRLIEAWKDVLPLSKAYMSRYVAVEDNIWHVLVFHSQKMPYLFCEMTELSVKSLRFCLMLTLTIPCTRPNNKNKALNGTAKVIRPGIYYSDDYCNCSWQGCLLSVGRGEYDYKEVPDIWAMGYTFVSPIPNRKELVLVYIKILFQQQQSSWEACNINKMKHSNVKRKKQTTYQNSKEKKTYIDDCNDLNATF